VGYGLGPYGFGPYGDPFGGSSISVVSAWAITTHGVRVTLTGEPAAEDQFAAGDATNAATWEVLDVTTGRSLTVVLATMHDSTTVDLATLEPLGDHLETHRVTAAGLLSALGTPATSPLSADFAGVVNSTDPIDATALVDFRDRDLANPPFQAGRDMGAGGTLVFGSDGDLETETGRPLTRKLIIRRLTTRRGTMPHLPQYGLELDEKEPVPNGGDFVALLRDVEEQVKQEPDVVEVRATGTADARRGVLIIQVAYTDIEGSTINLRMGRMNGRIMEI
jgi:hypothetical protein